MGSVLTDTLEIVHSDHQVLHNALIELETIRDCSTQIAKTLTGVVDEVEFLASATLVMHQLSLLRQGITNFRAILTSSNIGRLAYNAIPASELKRLLQIIADKSRPLGLTPLPSFNQIYESPVSYKITPQGIVIYVSIFLANKENFYNLFEFKPLPLRFGSHFGTLRSKYQFIGINPDTDGFVELSLAELTQCHHLGSFHICKNLVSWNSKHDSCLNSLFQLDQEKSSRLCDFFLEVETEDNAVHVAHNKWVYYSNKPGSNYKIHCLNNSISNPIQLLSHQTITIPSSCSVHTESMTLLAEDTTVSEQTLSYHWHLDAISLLQNHSDPKAITETIEMLKQNSPRKLLKLSEIESVLKRSKELPKNTFSYWTVFVSLGCTLFCVLICIFCLFKICRHDINLSTICMSRKAPNDSDPQQPRTLQQSLMRDNETNDEERPSAQRPHGPFGGQSQEATAPPRE